MSTAAMITLILQLLPLVFRGVHEAESLYKESKSGPVKKDHVVGLISTSLDAAVAAGAPLTGEEKDIIKSGMGPVIDESVGLFNATKWGLSQEDTSHSWR